MNIPFLGPPELIRQSHGDDPLALPVANWITIWDFQETIDIGLIAVPLAKGGRTYAGVDFAPNALRKLLVAFTTYDAKRDEDLRELRVRHVGDVQLFATDVGRSQAQVEEALAELFAFRPHFLPVILGGDHSVTYSGFRGFRRARRVRAGLVYFGAQHALRELPADVGSRRPPRAAVPEDSIVRAMIEDGLLVASNVAQLGLHGFRGSREERRYAEAQGMMVITAGEVQRRGVEASVADALFAAGNATEAIYVTVNGNVLDLPYAPAAADGQFGGLRADELLDAVYLLGQDPRVHAFDLVGIDAHQDQLGLTVQVGCSILLNFLAGANARRSRLGLAKDISMPTSGNG